MESQEIKSPKSEESVRAEVALDVILQNPEVSPSDDFQQTYFSWREQARKLAFVYDYLLERKRKRLNRINVIIMGLSTMVTLISAAQFGVDQTIYSPVLTSLQVILTVSALTSTVLGGIVNVYGLNSNIDIMQRYLDSVEGFYCMMVAEDGLPTEVRTDRKSFVMSNRIRWQEILRHAPSVGTSDYLKALHEFESSKNRFKMLTLPNFSR